MKITSFIICLLFLVSCKKQVTSDQQVNLIAKPFSNEKDNPLYAQIGFENRILDLGKIVSFDNNPIIHFTNEGDTTLIINEVYTLNDRLEVLGFTFEIAPGEEGKIRLRIDKDIEHQAYSDYIFVRTNNNNNNKPSLARLELKYELSDNLEIGGEFVEEGDRINVRMFPSLEATVLFGLETGDSVTCTGAMHKDYVADFDSDLWYYVDYNGRKGWVLSTLTKFKKTKTVALK